MPKNAKLNAEQNDDGKINIALFCDAFYPSIDGVVTVVNHYARILKDKANVFVVAPRRKGYKDAFDYEVVRCLATKVPILGYDYAMPQIDSKFINNMKKRKIDIIHIHSPFNIGKMGVAIAKEKKIPVVATMHSQFKQDFKRATKSEFISNILLKDVMKVFNNCTEVWAVNENTQDVLKSYGYKKPSYVMKSGTEMLPIDKEAARKKIYEKHNIPDNVPVFLFVGRMIVMKSIFMIADSLKIIKDRGIDFRMIYVGDGMDLADLKKHVTELGLDDKVIFTGSIKDRKLLAEYYAASKLMLFPSVYDTDGLVKYEGASQHTPTVLMEGIAATAGVVNDHNGYISKPSTEGFAEKIIEVLGDEEKYKEVSENAFKELYRTWDQKVDDAYNRYLYLIDEYKKKQEHKAKIKQDKKERKEALKNVPRKKRTMEEKNQIIRKYNKRKKQIKEKEKQSKKEN